MNRLTTLDSTCSAGSPPLRRRLAQVLESYLADLEQGAALDQEALLSAHPDLADDLRPYLDSLRMLYGATRDLRAARVTAPENQEDEAVARQIGDYQIIREIGRGGMGIVYEAHQKSLNRQVALKVLPFAAVLDQRQIARFRNEAQAAAQLHHPHIVPVYAVGQEQGVYYYAMQYVAGQTLAAVISECGDSSPLWISEDGESPTSLVRSNGLEKESGDKSPHSKDTRPLAALSTLRTTRPHDFFRTVARLGKEAAEALQHAHEFGIIHRDVKPSNLLVDEEGKLWVTDFGLARMQTGSGVTLTGDVVGTLRYMSPEQASGQSALVDVRTDVYSLGVTLYELLTKRAAFPGDDRQDVMRRIAAEEPISPRRLNQSVPIDLETIVLSAMSKTRDERYPTARALADDLERFLVGKPTLARRPTLADRAAKWARRHRPLVLVGACALAMMSAISSVAVVLLAREQARTSEALVQAEESAKAARESFARAERHFLQAREAVDQFGMRLAERLLDIPGAEPVRRDVLLDTLKYYRKFLNDAGDDPKLRHELALAHFKSGVIGAKLGATGDAIKEYRAAQKLFGDLVANDVSSADAVSQLALAHNNLALLLAGAGKVDQARGEYKSAIAIQKGLVSKHPADTNFASQLAESHANLGMLLDQVGDMRAAEKALEAAVGVLRPLAESLPGEPKHAHHLSIALNNLSFVLRKRDAQAAEAAVRHAISRLEPVVQAHPDRTGYQDDLALCFNNLAALLSRDRLSEAIAWHKKAIAVQEQLARKAPAVVRHRSDLAISFNNLGVAYSRADQAAAADDAFGNARKLFATLAQDYPDEVAYQSSLAALLNNQALALADARRHNDALAIYPSAIQSQRISLKSRPDSPMMREVLSKMHYNYGQSLRATGRLDEAAQQALARRDLWRGNGERLLGVAAELAQIGTATDGVVAQNIEQWDDEAVATLRQAHKGGWPAGVDLARDERFARLNDNQEIKALITELNQQPKPKAKLPAADDHSQSTSSSKTN
jgi:serine/threonine protein kinase/tetratricopeptide (TPR) repeat protein